MLKLVLGGSGSGKTSWLYAQLAQRAARKESSILLVPEQFTSSTEGRIYRELGTRARAMWRAFPSPAWPSGSSRRRGAPPSRPSPTRAGSPWCAGPWRSCRTMSTTTTATAAAPAFCQLAAETIDELKSAGVTGEEFARLARGCGPESGRPGRAGPDLRGLRDPALPHRDGPFRPDSAGGQTGWKRPWLRAGSPPFWRGGRCSSTEFDTFNAPKQRADGGHAGGPAPGDGGPVRRRRPRRPGGPGPLFGGQGGGGPAAAAGPEKRRRGWRCPCC